MVRALDMSGEVRANLNAMRDDIEARGGEAEADVSELHDQLTALVADVTALRTGQANLVTDVAALFGGDALLSAPGLAIGTSSAAAIKHNAFTVRNDGVERLIAAGEVAFTATTHDIADPDANPKEAIYVLSVAPGQTVPVITKGDDAEADAAVAPATPANAVKIGEVKVQHDGGAIFNATTDDLSAAHLTDTYTDAAAGTQASSAPAALTATAPATLTSDSPAALTSEDFTK